MQDDTEQENGAPRSFWSGTIAFGLVSLPVSLYVANRRNAVSLRMLDEDGTPLARRYFCTQDEKPLSADDLIRGYEVERGKFVEVEDEELQAIVPEKSREIDLRRFVPLDGIDPMYFERAYFLVPDKNSNKAYRLLAASMEEEGRAGIATFVMRGKEYLIAIIAERGILRAETLRFHDELRTPEDIGLPEPGPVNNKQLTSILSEIESLNTDKLNREELTDTATQKMLELVERKLESGDDVIHAPEEPDTEPESAEIIDLMQILKQSLGAETHVDAEGDLPQGGSRSKSDSSENEPAKRRFPKKSHAEQNESKQQHKTQGSKKPEQNAKSKSRKTEKEQNHTKNTASKKSAPEKSAAHSNAQPRSRKPKPKLDPNTSKTELYELAKDLHISGRSQMSKDELYRAVQRQH